MNKNKLILILLITFTLIGGFLRFYKITQNPPSLNGDEVSFGYSAYSVLKTGKDEFGKFLPLVFKSVGDYKNPIPAYLMMIPIKIFGLTDFAVRFPNALFGTLAIPITYLFLFYITKDKKFSIIGTGLTAISAWQIYFSRFAYEPLIGSFFDLLGIWFWMRSSFTNKKYLLFSAFFFVLSMYTGFSTRLFTPLFVAVLTFYSLITKKIGFKNAAIFVGMCILFSVPLAYTILFGGAGTRMQMVFIFNDIEFARYVLLKWFNSAWDIPLLFFFWIKRYLNYLDPNFLFMNGLRMTQSDTFGLGPLYLFELPFFVVGIFRFIKEKILHKDIFVIWLITGFIPDSLTNNQQHAGRLLHLAIVFIIIVTIGIIAVFNWLKALRNQVFKIGLIISYTVFTILILIHAFLIFNVNFPRDKSENFDEGLKEASLFVAANHEKYKEIVFDTRHGVDAPSMISNPYLYLVFYLKYDPKTYQNIEKTYGSNDNPNYHFDKYTFRYINWPKDCYQNDNLFIGSPWSFPGDLSGVNLLKTIYLSSGSAGYYVVTGTCR